MWTVVREPRVGGGPRNARQIAIRSARAMRSFESSGAVTGAGRVGPGRVGPLSRDQRAAATAACARAWKAVWRAGGAAPMVAAVRMDCGTTWVNGCTATASDLIALSEIPVASRPVRAAEK